MWNMKCNTDILFWKHDWFVLELVLTGLERLQRGWVVRSFFQSLFSLLRSLRYL